MTVPYINLKTTVKLSDSKQEKLKALLGKAIECFPGKTESFLMVCIEDQKKIWFRGDNSTESAVVDVDLFGEVSPESSEKMTGEICRAITDVADIPSDRVYVKYSGFKNWGWNGKNF